MAEPMDVSRVSWKTVVGTHIWGLAWQRHPDDKNTTNPTGWLWVRFRPDSDEGDCIYRYIDVKYHEFYYMWKELKSTARGTYFHNNIRTDRPYTMLEGKHKSNGGI